MKPDPQKASAPLAPDTLGSRVLVSGEADRLNNTHRAYREIRERILSGVMEAGSQYLEQELAEILGMSRTPVREALIRLQDERLVEVKPRHGARILGVSAEDLADIYEITSDLEASAVRRVARNGILPEALTVMQAALAKMDEAAAARNIVDWVHWDNEFHQTLVDAARNRRLSEIFSGLMAQVYRARQSTLSHRSVPIASNKEHLAILDAVRAGDSDLAHKLMYDHRMRSRTELVAYLKQTARAV